MFVVVNYSLHSKKWGRFGADLLALTLSLSNLHKCLPRWNLFQKGTVWTYDLLLRSAAIPEHVG